MEHQELNKENIFDKVENLTKTSIDLVKLKTIDGSTSIITSLFSSAFFLIVFLMFLFSLNIASGFWFGNYFDNYFIGFIITAAINFTLFFVLLLVKRSFESKIKDIILSKFLKKIDLDEIIN